MALPVAAIICIALACWVVVILLLFALYKFLKSRGTCACDCKLCGEEDAGCCSCCISLSDACNCCNPSINGCLDRICPGNKKISCADIILCQCCANPGEESCCLKVFPCCRHDSECCVQTCPCDDCECCDVDCYSCCANCKPVVCGCLEIRLVSKAERHDAPSSAAIYTTKSVPDGDRQRPKLSTESATSQHSDNSSVSLDAETDTIGTARSISHVQLISNADVYERIDKPAQKKKRTRAKLCRDGEIISNVKRSKPAVSDKDKISPSRSLPRRKPRRTTLSKTKSNSCDETSLSRTLPSLSRALPSPSLSRTLPSPPRDLPLRPKVGSKDKSGAISKQKGAQREQEDAGELVEVSVVKQGTVPLSMYGHQGAMKTWDHGTLQGAYDLSQYPYQSGVSPDLSDMEMAPASMHAYPIPGKGTNWNYTQNSFVGAESSVETASSHPVTSRRPLPMPTHK